MNKPSNFISLFIFQKIVFIFRAQIDELQKKQDHLNSFKNSKLYSNTGVHSSREAYGESPVKRSLPSVKSSRSSSFNRPHIKRLTAVKSFYSF